MSNNDKGWVLVKLDDTESQDSALLGVGAWTQRTTSFQGAPMLPMSTYSGNFRRGTISNAAQNIEKKCAQPEVVAHHEVSTQLAIYSQLKASKVLKASVADSAK